MDDVRQDDYSVGQVAAVLGVSSSTIRSWTNRFAAYTSELAQPDVGVERRYTLDDIALFNSVLVLRKQGEPMARIIPRIDDGERLEPAEPAEPPPPRRKRGELMSEEQQKLERNFARLSGEYDVIKEERDYLRGQITAMTERAIAAETELRILKEQPSQQPTPAPAAEPTAEPAPAPPDEGEPGEDESPRRWYQFWK